MLRGSLFWDTRVHVFVLYARLVNVGETFNRFADFGILGSELHKNAFGGRTRWEGELYQGYLSRGP